MSLTNIEQAIPVKPAQALANPLFPALDNTLRTGRHIGLDELDNHTFLVDFQDYLEEFYTHYSVELVRAPEGFFCLRPRSATPILHSALSGLDIMVGKTLCYLYLSPECLANEGTFTQQELYDELLTLADESRLLKLVNNRFTGSDLDHQKLREKMRVSLNRLRRLGMVQFMSCDSNRFRITESVFRFGADMRADGDPCETQRRPIRDGEAMALENHLQLDDESEENRPGSGEGE